MKFILIFYATYFMLSIISWKIADGSMEFLLPVLLFNVAYFITTSFIWVIANRFIKVNAVIDFVLKYFIGLIAVNILSFFMFKNVPFFVILESSHSEGEWSVSLFLHIIYSLSFVAAFFIKTNKGSVIRATRDSMEEL